MLEGWIECGYVLDRDGSVRDGVQHVRQRELAKLRPVVEGPVEFLSAVR